MPKLCTLAAISLLTCAACAAQPQGWPVRVLPQEAPALAAPTPEASLLERDASAPAALALSAPATSESSDARIGPPRGSGAGSRRVKLER
jgi:hypothetical protein